jgi:hypothetical protein
MKVEIGLLVCATYSSKLPLRLCMRRGGFYALPEY